MRRMLIVKVFRDVAVLAFLVMFFHVVTLMLGHSFTLARLTFYMPVPVGTMAVMLSALMHYCRLHQICLGYSTLVSFCMDQTALGDGFGNHLLTARIVMLSIGFIILCLVARRLYRKELWTRKERSE